LSRKLAAVAYIRAIYVDHSCSLPCAHFAVGILDQLGLELGRLAVKAAHIEGAMYKLYTHPAWILVVPLASYL